MNFDKSNLMQKHVDRFSHSPNYISNFFHDKIGVLNYA